MFKCAGYFYLIKVRCYNVEGVGFNQDQFQVRTVLTLFCVSLGKVRIRNVCYFIVGFRDRELMIKKEFDSLLYH